MIEEIDITTSQAAWLRERAETVGRDARATVKPLEAVAL